MVVQTFDYEQASDQTLKSMYQSALVSPLQIVQQGQKNVFVVSEDDLDLLYRQKQVLPNVAQTASQKKQWLLERLAESEESIKQGRVFSATDELFEGIKKRGAQRLALANNR